jgi:endonuclease/exonuclease/phosphatase family metal-dependent hydrolase
MADTAPAEGCSFRLMSFNLGGFVSARPKAHHWSRRVSLVVEVLHSHRPELLAAQEVQPGNVPDLRNALPGHAAFWGPATHACPPSPEATYNPIFWLQDRFRCVQAGGFFLSQTPEIWSYGWDAVSVRGVTWVHLVSRESGHLFLVCSVHLDHRGKCARIQASHLIISRLNAIWRNRHGPICLAGDFNSRAWAPADEHLTTYPPPILSEYLPEAGTIYRIYSSAGFKDAFIEAGFIESLDTNTYHDFRGNRFPPVALRTDWILYRDESGRTRIADYAVIQSSAEGHFPSDHYPILADLVLYP